LFDVKVHIIACPRPVRLIFIRRVIVAGKELAVGDFFSFQQWLIGQYFSLL